MTRLIERICLVFAVTLAWPAFAPTPTGQQLLADLLRYLESSTRNGREQSTLAYTHEKDLPILIKMEAAGEGALATPYYEAVLKQLDVRSYQNSVIDWFTQAIPQLPSLRAVLLRRRLSPDGKTFRLPLTQASFAIAKGLYESGELKNITQIEYGTPPQTQTVALSHPDQLDFQKFPHWVLENNQRSLFASALTVRNEWFESLQRDWEVYGSEASRSKAHEKIVRQNREALTKKIIGVIEHQDPVEQPQLIDLVRKQLAGPKADRFPKSGEPPVVYETLTIHNTDWSDIWLARLLHHRAMLANVQAMQMVGAPDKRVEKGVASTANFPNQNYVSGKVTVDLLVAETDGAGRPVWVERPDGRIWRGNPLMDQVVNGYIPPVPPGAAGSCDWKKAATRAQAQKP